MSDEDGPSVDEPEEQLIDYELDAELDAETPERLKALADPLRSVLCDLVLERAMSVTELAERVGRPRGTVAYHVDLLVTAGLFKVVRSRRVRAVDERFYGRVARTFTIHKPPGDLPFTAEAGSLRRPRPERPADRLQPPPGPRPPPAGRGVPSAAHRPGRGVQRRAPGWRHRVRRLRRLLSHQPIPDPAEQR